jgi:hypothetical protein
MRSSMALCLGVLLAWVAHAHADGPLGPDGSPIQTSSYALDLYQGPVFAGTRVTGLAGAYVAIAEDVDGDLQNPASPAIRPYYSVDHFDYWLGVGLTFPSALARTDFFNTGRQTELQNADTSFLFLTPALNLQWGAFGLGLTAELQNYQLEETSRGDDTKLGALVVTTHIQAAYAMLDHQLTFGYGVRLLSLSILKGGNSATGQPIFTSSGIGIEVGVLVSPTDQPFRIGAALRSRLETEVEPSSAVQPDENGDFVVMRADGERAFVPVTATLPWDVNIGVAYQLGRPLNPRWIDPADALVHLKLEQKKREEERVETYKARLKAGEDLEELRDQIDAERRKDREALQDFAAEVRRRLKLRYKRMKRPYLLASSALVISGPVSNAVGVESFLHQVVNRSGEAIVFSPRLGLEGEAWPNWLKLRAGTYLEPTRFASSDPRTHFTFGGDLKLISWDVFGLWPSDYTWRLGAAIDVAERYFVWAVSVGGWH